MSKWIIVAIIVLIVLVSHYLMNKYKQQAVQVITLESFLQESTIDENAWQKKGVIDVNKNHVDGEDHGDGDDDGDDGGD
ncbi:hypothetical protein FGG79_03520 [Bacillus sp. BHET2]|uniref:hypothetical protein n=1 Tax=Bacillus sp. BHET2 TaxID=2583818 RepID=UPI00110EAFD4|nr:hypothetical protein [Bacillus sp. BHET2]TMU87216.1 hypothetical protein FGG79_03520 [Bacillus sp. BHET2]